jgi:release factor glutamine methyltransferase
MRVRELLLWAKSELASRLEQPLFEAELLLSYYLQKSRTFLHTHDDMLVKDVEGYKKLIARRKEAEPYEYIVGKANFYDIELRVNRHVLIPRPETELLVEKVSEVIERENIRYMVEVGVGSGAISIVLARRHKVLKVTAIDISPEALKVAQRNVVQYGLEKQITLQKGDLLDTVEGEVTLVVSNPPYIANDASLEKNVSGYEPHLALFGGTQGDELLKRLILQAKEKGVKFLCCEMGYDQRSPIETFVKHHFVNEFSVKYLNFYKDYAGLDRGFVLAYRD